VLERLLDQTYRRLGALYPRRALLAALLLNEVVILVAVAALSLYLDMSGGEFVLVLLPAFGFELVHDLLAIPLIRRSTQPIIDWLEGARDERMTPVAWRTAASLPWEFVRRDATPLSAFGSLVWIFIPAWCGYLAWQLALPAYQAAVIFVGAAVYFAYAYVLRFLAVERVMRPVVEQIARALPEPAPPAAGLSLRARLLVSLPAINVITAVFTYGLARGGDAQLSDLAVVSLVATAVAATVSLALTVLLSDSITAPIAELRAAALRVGEGDLAVRVPVVTTDETGDLARAFNEMTVGLVERERIREAFGTYVDREVAEHILREGTALVGEEVEVTAMFLDIRNFTGFAERSSAPEVVATLNRLFERIVPIIHNHGGHVDKFVGDGLLAVFGAPRRQPDHADQGLGAAIEIAASVEEEFAGELSVGVGLNSGTVVAGNVGGAGRLEFSVIGDVVNVAARVESATRQTGDIVLLSEHTRRLLRGSLAALQERPAIPLKGKTTPVALYAPASEPGEQPPARREGEGA
jgi:class 3 adenylate cyclase